MAEARGTGWRQRSWLTGLFIVAATGIAAAEDRMPAASLGDTGLTFRTPDDTATLQIGGRFHGDIGSGGSRRLTDEFPAVSRVRRTWIEPTLTVDKVLIFGLQYDAASRTEPVNNLIVSYKGLGGVTLTGGNFKEPFSLEQMMSNNDVTFAERSLADAFSPSRNTGAAVGVHGDAWTLAAGVFGGNVNSSVERGGLAGTARATITPIRTDKTVLHLGLAGSVRSLDRQGPDLAFASRPESELFRTSLVDTGTIDGARQVRRLGLEAAWSVGPVRLQGEYIATRIERLGERDLGFEGGYVQAAWVINGDAPRYATEAETATEIGVFKRVQPTSGQRVSNGGPGVFELAARYSTIDLSSRNVRGGVQQDVTAGINWYPEPYIRLTANYVRAWADPTAETVTRAPARADIGQLRIQIAF